MDDLKVHYWRRQWVRILRADDYKNISQHYKAVVGALVKRDRAKAELELKKIDEAMRAFGSGWLMDSPTSVQREAKETQHGLL